MSKISFKDQTLNKDMKEIKLQLEIRKQILEAQIKVCETSGYNGRGIQKDLLEAELKVIQNYIDCIPQ